MLHPPPASVASRPASSAVIEVNGHQLVKELPRPRYYFVTPGSAAGSSDPILRCQVCGVVCSGTSVFEQYSCQGPPQLLGND